MIGYLVSLSIIMISTHYFKLMNYGPKYLISLMIAVAFMLVRFFLLDFAVHVIATISILIIAIIYLREIQTGLRYFRQRVE